MPEFVGRDDTLAAVVGALDRGPALVVVEGEPGIGKSRLVREALQAPGVRNRTVLVVACPPVAEPFPLGPVIDGLRRLRVDVGGVGLSALGGALRSVFPEWSDALPPALEALDDAKETRHRLSGALTELIERLGVEILVVEDAHWADTATLDWLLTLTAAEPAVCSVVVTYRPTDVPEGSLLTRLTSRVPAGMGHVRVELAPLDVADTRRLVESMLGTDAVSEEFASFLHERTDGVPLAVEESVRLLRERHDIIRRRDGWTRRVLDELEVPPTVRDSVLERVDRLDPDTRTVLQAAAILAEPTDGVVLAAVADLDEEPARIGIARALGSGLLHETRDSRLAFRHVLDAHAVEGAIPASEQWQFHKRAAEALRQWQPEPVVWLARHYRAANDTEQWCHYAEQAADLALASGDDHTAVKTLLTVLDSIDHPVERRVRLTRKLGEAAFFGGSVLQALAKQVTQALREALSIKSLPRRDRGELRLLLGRMLWLAGHGLSSFEETEAAIADLRDRRDLAIVAMTNLAMPVIPDWSASRHLRWLNRATRAAERSEAPTDRLGLVGAQAVALLFLGDETGWTAADKIPQSVSSINEQRRLANWLVNVAWAMLPWGRYEHTRHQLDLAERHIVASGYGRRAGSVRSAKLYIDWYTGHWDGLDAAAAQLAAADDMERSERVQARQLVGLMDLVSGARSKSEHWLREVVVEDALTDLIAPEDMAVPAALGSLRLADGDTDAALRETVPAVDMIARKGVWLWATDIASVHVDALIAAENRRDAEEFVEQFAVGLGDVNAPAPQTALLMCRAILSEARGDLIKAAGLFADAASAWAAMPRPYDELLALERQARCLLAAGEQDKALALLSETEQRLRELGAKWDADRVAHTLRQLGVEVARVWRGGRRGYGDQLSPRELEVVKLVAQGMTNRQIAEVLFLSYRTVELHVRKAMRKLDVSSRTTLAVAATDAGLIPRAGEISE